MAVFLYCSVVVNVVLVLLLAFLARRCQGQDNFSQAKIIKDIFSSCFPISLSKKYFGDKQLKNDISLPISGIYKRRKSGFEALSLPSYSIVFLGDSLIQTCEWAELMDDFNVKNRGIAGDTIEMVLDRLPQVTRFNPSQLLLMVGINDLCHRDCNLEATLEQYKKLLEQINQTSPDTQILVHSVLPVNCAMFEKRFRKNGKHINLNVLRFNQELELLVNRCQAQYINLLSLLTNSSGQLSSIYTVDGLHLSGEAYGVWGQYLRPFLADRQ